MLAVLRLCFRSLWRKCSPTVFRMGVESESSDSAATDLLLAEECRPVGIVASKLRNVIIAVSEEADTPTSLVCQ